MNTAHQCQKRRPTKANSLDEQAGALGAHPVGQKDSIDSSGKSAPWHERAFSALCRCGGFIRAWGGMVAPHRGIIGPCGRTAGWCGKIVLPHRPVAGRCGKIVPPHRGIATPWGKLVPPHRGIIPPCGKIILPHRGIIAPCRFGACQKVCV